MILFQPIYFYFYNCNLFQAGSEVNRAPLLVFHVCSSNCTYRIFREWNQGPSVAKNIYIFKSKLIGEEPPLIFRERLW